MVFMRSKLFDRIWHKTLARPYRLSKRVDIGSGPLVVLLHGVGNTGMVWQHLVEELQDLPIRVVAFDLLGFGSSPKPIWPEYNVDDHVRSVVSSIERLRPVGPIILVGHSMGCLVAVRLAKTRPDLVKHLVLYEMPLLKGLPNKRYYRLRLNFYYKLNKWIQDYEPSFNGQHAKLSERLVNKFFGFNVDRDSWQPFIKSLKNTIFEQSTPEDIPQLVMPMDVIYGSYDMLVIRGTVQHVFGSETDQLHVHTVRVGHRITRKASKLLRKRIIAAMESSTISDSETTNVGT
jgi:pimeloyl-ACP methyl ester carboxylesterase